MRTSLRSAACSGTAAAVLALTTSYSGAGDDGEKRPQRPSPEICSPIFGVALPAGYRRWELIAPSHRPDFDEIRGVLGNAVAMNAYRAGTVPFPDGSVLVKAAWKHVPSAESQGAFVPGDETTVQVMVKDSRRYASTGGWGFGRFTDGKPADEAQHRTCFACHRALVKNHDWVFTQLAR